MKVLICDDEPEFLQELCDALAGFGHQVSAATTLKQAAALMHGNVFDAFVTDIRLPKETFQSVVTAIHELGCAQPAKIVVMTGHADDGMVDAIRTVCGWPVLLKPFALHDLEANLLFG